jgi:hypothetical protein
VRGTILNRIHPRESTQLRQPPKHCCTIRRVVEKLGRDAIHASTPVDLGKEIWLEFSA